MNAVVGKINGSKGHIAAQIARDTATGSMSEYFTLLSSKMCWDAAIECQVLAGVERPAPVSYTHLLRFSRA